MSFRATNVTPMIAYQTVKSAAVQLKINIDAIVLYLTSNNASYDYLRGIYQTLERANNQFDTLKVTPGLPKYAKIQEDDPTYDVVNEFIAMQSAIQSAMVWMQTNIPLTVAIKPVSDWGTGNLVQTEFTPLDTTPFRTILSSVSSSIA